MRRSVTGLFAVGLGAAMGAVFFVRWYNRLPERLNELDAYGGPLFTAALYLSLALIVVSIVGLVMRLPAVRVSCVAALVAVVLTLISPVGLAFAPLLVLVFAGLALVGVTPMVPGAFFLVAGMRCVMDAWRKPTAPDRIVAAELFAMMGFNICLYIGLCLRMWGQLRRGD